MQADNSVAKHTTPNQKNALGDDRYNRHPLEARKTMNIKLKVLSVSTILALTSCGGSDSPVQSPRQSFITQQLSDTAYDSGTDLTIENFTVTPADNTFEIQVSNNGENPLNTDNLSFSLEYSKTGDFQRPYRVALFDQQVVQSTNSSATISARSRPAALPSGNYLARLEVNPDWHMYIENNFQDISLSQPLYYISETNYDNNKSSTFQMPLNTDIQCTEDTYENNNSFDTATRLNSKDSISASLCEDNADYYALPSQANQTTVLSFQYRGSPDTTPTQYTIISDDFFRQDSGILEAPESKIQFTAAVSGNYYLAIFGSRTDYTISRDHQPALAADWFFSTDTVAGPDSPVYGPVTLNRLNFNTSDLLNKSAHCRKQIIDPLDPTSYTTPPHFPGIHEFRFLENNIYLKDGETRYQWAVVTGDISNDDWYDNPYQGWAENLFDGSWRYWDFNGESYVQCAFR